MSNALEISQSCTKPSNVPVSNENIVMIRSMTFAHWFNHSGSHFNIKIPSYQYKNSYYKDQIDGLAQDYSNSIAKALELLQSCTKPLRQSPDNDNGNSHTWKDSLYIEI